MKNRRLVLALAVAMVFCLGGISFYFWYMNNHYVSTEDARVSADMYKVSPQISGEILEINVQEGQAVRAGEVVARLSDTALSPSANTDLTLVKAPSDGLVVKKLAQPGEVAAAGQPILMLVDPRGLYVTANIEEDKLSRVRAGQKVDISLDAQPGKKYAGHVERIGKASLSAFSLLPAASGSSFTKVVQRVPVKIVFDEPLPDYVEIETNAYVRVHVK
jgi:multidrug resistance efflux pump